jgi:hypothetical protein
LAEIVALPSFAQKIGKAADSIDETRLSDGVTPA